VTDTPQGRWHIGVIGGSGLAGGISLDEAQDIEVASAFGQPSGPVRTGLLEGRRFTFIARHGAGHSIPPGGVNYRANIDVLKRCGVTDVLALSAIGSLREEMAPGEFVAVDQFIDRTQGRENSFFGPGVVGHVSLADPVCSRISRIAAQAARSCGAVVHDAGCYVAIEGPQFSTRAESRMYRQWGGDVIGMTAMPEARLAREAELPYALLGMVTDWDSWRDGEAGVEASQILAVIAANVALAEGTLRALAAALPEVREASPIDTALDHAIITDKTKWPAALVTRLGAVAGRVLKAD
jgi:5'-methylthioadenosine phosphorylase